MGLDNGLIIRGKNRKGADFLRKMNLEETNVNSERYELGYWRKCCNIRNKVLEEFKNKGYDGEGGHIDLTISDLYKFRDIMKYFLIENNWVVGNPWIDGSIWEWSTMLPSIGRTIRDIDFLYEALENEEDPPDDNDLEIYFYDSY